MRIETPVGLVRRLMADGLVSAEQVLAGRFEVADLSKRNLNRAVTWQGGGIFVKQGNDPDRAKTVAHEVEVLRFLRGRPGFAPLCDALPRPIGAPDDAPGALFEHIADAETCHARILRTGKLGKWPSVALARVLAALHGLTRLDGPAPRLAAALNRRAPFGLTFDAPDRNVLHESSAGALGLIRIVQQQPELLAAYATLREGWQTQCLIHGDLRWDNCLLLPGGGRRRAPRIRVIDWELALYGDPAWDLAAWIADHLGLWLKSVPVTETAADDTGFARAVSQAGFPLPVVRPPVQAFWAGYTRARGLAPADAQDLQRRTVTHVAARLVQTAFEWANMAAEPPAHALLALQLADNIFRSPDDASVHLLGLVDPVELPS